MTHRIKKQPREKQQCTICLQRNTTTTLDQCRHHFCFRCIRKWSQTNNNCPLCRQPYTSLLHRGKQIAVSPPLPAPQPVRAVVQQVSRPLYYMPVLLYPQINCMVQRPFLSGGFMMSQMLSSALSMGLGRGSVFPSFQSGYPQ